MAKEDPAIEAKFKRLVGQAELHLSQSINAINRRDDLTEKARLRAIDQAEVRCSKIIQGAAKMRALAYRQKDMKVPPLKGKHRGL